MTETSVNLLIVAGLSVGLMYVLWVAAPRAFLENESKTSATQNNITPTQKSIWDKLKIISIVLSSITALIFAIVKAIELFNGPVKP